MIKTDRAWVATRKGLFELRRQAAPPYWTFGAPTFPGDPVSMVLPPPADGGPMLAALNLGHFGVKLHASDDAGSTWAEVATPAFPPQPEAAEGPAWKLAQIWSLEAAHGTVWAGTIPGGLFRSGDGGRNWTLVESLWQRPERLGWFGGGYDAPGIHSICPHPHRPGEVLIGISCGGAWHTADDGATWALRATGMRAAYMPPEQAGEPNTQDPHRIVRCAAAPDVLWCQHHNGIFRSSDDASRWQEVTDAPVSTFGFAVAVHPQQPQTAWFAPAVADMQRVPVDARLAVTRTDDGAASFQSQTRGLPQGPAYDLVYRHGLAVDDSGDALLMGSTTGGLWSTIDGGDCWHLVAAHLPPIYAVRFG